MPGEVEAQLSLSPDDFRKVLQLTHELYNFPDVRLTELGIELEALREFLLALSAARHQISDETEEVRIFAASEENFPPSKVQEKESVRVSAPYRLIQLWPESLSYVLDKMSPEEMYLRTGCRTEELRQAIETMRFT